MVRKAKVIARNFLNLITQYDTNNETDVPGKHLDVISSSKCPISVQLPDVGLRDDDS